MLVDARGNPLTLSAITSTRDDSWINSHTGIGSYADKTVHGVFAPVFRIFDAELTSLFNGSALAAKIVEKPVREMFRRGYKLRCDTKEVEETECNELHDYANEILHVDDNFQRAQIFANLYGGVLDVMGADDGGASEEPLDEEGIQSFTFLNPIDRRFAYVQSYYVSPTEPKHGEAQTYLTSNAVAGYERRTGAKLIGKRKPSAIERSGGQIGIVHESRCIRFEGVSTDQVTMQTLAGWTWSVLQRLYDDLRKFEHSFDSMQYLLADASQAVFSLKGVHEAISGGKKEKVLQRIAMLEEVRSVMHGVLLDSGGNEKFERSSTPFGGIADLLDKCMLRFAASADMPVTELFGRAASGLNAAAGADSETRKWYDQIASRQESQLGPRLRRFYRLLAMSKDCPVKLPKTGKDGRPLKWRIEFNPLYTATDLEQAQTDLAVAQRNVAYVESEIVSAEEVAPTLKRLYPDMDLEARKIAQEAMKSFDPHEEDEDPILPGGEQLPIGPPGNLPGGNDQPPPAPGGKPPLAKTKAAPAAPPAAKTKPAPKAKK